MRYFLKYSVDGLMTEIHYPGKPTLNPQSNGRLSWHPFKFTLIDSSDIMKIKPLSFLIEGIDKEGCVIEKWEINKIESYSEKDSVISVKFGYAIHNY